jgi:uridylate kinase
VILKGTKVDGVYTADPVKDPSAKKYDFIAYRDVLKKNLKVMDSTAIALCMENDLPIVVFNVRKRDNITRILKGGKVGTTVAAE